MAKCPVCKGGGRIKIPCHVCGGQGMYVAKDPEAKHGIRVVNCLYCSGTGGNWGRCARCNGSGFVDEGGSHEHGVSVLQG